MTDLFRYAQLQTFSLNGSGAIAGATSFTLKSMTDIDGNALSMATDFGAIGFGTLEPGNGTSEEQVCFTGLSNNANGTVTLSGVSNVSFLYPYTQTSGLSKTHAGSTTFVISNTSGFYDKLTAKADDETITGLWTFPNDASTPLLGSSYVAPTLNNQVASKGYADSLTFAGAPNATTTQKGIVQLPTQAQVDARTATGSTAASLVITPDLVRTVLTHDYIASATGTDAYAITCVPAVTAYTTGDSYYFKADVANTGACTLAVNGLSAIPIKINTGKIPIDNYIAAGSLVHVQYDGTNMQILSVSAKPALSQNGSEIYAATATGNDTYVISLLPAITAYTTGQVFRFSLDVGNTGTATLNVNGVGALTIIRPDGSALQTGDLLANQVIEVIYDGTSLRLLSPLASFISLQKNGTTTRSGSTASGTLNIAHGLGITPKYVRITCTKSVGNDKLAMSVGSYNGATTSLVYFYNDSAGTAAATDTTNIVRILDASDDSAEQAATITVDATNLILAFTKTGSPSSPNINILWEANG